MKSRGFASRLRKLIVVCLVFVGMATVAEAKQIRLRNGTISTGATAKLQPTAKHQKDDIAVSGLFLIQFTGPLQPDWRQQLSGLGIDLLRYVPDDAFVSRLDHATPGQVRQLSFVQWMGEYRPDHKMHRSVRAQARGKAIESESAISVLLSPHATAPEIAEVRRFLHKLDNESTLRSGTILRGKIVPGRLNALAQSSAVLWIEPAPQMKLFDEVASKIVAGDGGVNTLYTQSLGYDGSGVKVTVTDTGLNSGDAATMHPDLFGRTPAFFHYGALDDAADEHSHGTHCAGIIAGNAATGEMDDNGNLFGLGVAPGASIIAQRIFDGDGNYTLTNSFDVLTHDAKSAGADIGSNSWGEDTHGRYDTSAMEFDELVRDADTSTPGYQPYILEFSAGNAGPGSQTVGSPAVAKNVIATGAAQNDRPDFLIYGDGPDAMADFSSRGPCEDGRIKPDLTAPGTWIASLQSASATDVYAWSPISPNYQYQGGTSQAGPHVSGAAAVFVHYYRATHTNATPSPALVKAALINSAADMDDEVETGPVPNDDEGWGRVDLTQLIGSTRQYEFLDQTVLLITGQQYEQRVLVATPDEPLKITLTYTDAPGFPGAIPALVNDLDLEVVGPDGRIFRGNQFAAGESVPDATTSDNINNVEAVRLLAPLPGEYAIRVRARSVVENALLETNGVYQDFALVVSASIAPPGTGILTFDRPAYRAPDVMKLRLVDYDLAGQPNATISLRSGTETNAFNVLLHSSGASGLLTGNVATATGPPLADGVLQVSHNDLIHGTYLDANPGATRVFTVRADLSPPAITNVILTNRFGHAEVRWTTDETASSVVRFGTNSSLHLAITNRTLTTTHAVTLEGLIPATTNFLKIICADAAGNIATNDNGGALFQFVAPRAPAILLVDALFEDFISSSPIENYTRPLTQLGLAHDVWSIETETNSITAAALQPYRVVIWRLPEASLSRPTFTASERAALTQYLDGGGALFVASMEATTRLEEAGAAGFRQNVLHVAQYTEDVTVPDASGVDNDPIGDGLSLTMDYTEYSDFDFSDTITPGTNAVGILVDSTGGYVGLRYPRVGVDSPSRVVYLSFPFDAIPEDDPPNDRATLLRRILVFLAPGLNGEGNVAFDRSAYTIPSQLTVEVADSDLEGQSQTSVTFFSTTQTNGLPLTLHSTPRPGVFRGTISLVATNTGGNDPELRVKHGDTVHADYLDASLSDTANASATVETNPPDISNVTEEPGYVDALVSWDTSEPADSIVQFGESPLLGRSASRDDFVDAHEVTLLELQPQRTYYYRVISRDRAGNVTVNDNNGQLHTFTTLTPLTPPWSDDLEHDSANWVVYTVEDSEAGWQLGAPNLFFGIDAHSLTNCWTTDRDFHFISQSETFLISPAILLGGGDQAKLRFWQSYDFTLQPDELGIFHGGEVLLIPNDVLAPITIAEYSDLDDPTDWHLFEFDLTPYAGQIVYVVWHYFLLSFDSWPRQGWFVDDVSISGTNVAGGAIRITNNLWQSRYVLSGPLNQNGKGLGALIANAPPGPYSITFANVPYYQTPLSQSNTLSAGATLQFNGNYAFIDANQNGIPDAWELQFFGNVSANRTALTDTDGDGMTDLSEAMAGTDPNSPPPPFNLTARLTNGLVRLDWLTAPGHNYRIHTSTNATTLVPFSGWISATGPVTNFMVAPVNNGVANLFRVEVADGSGPNSLAPVFRVSPQLLTNGAVRLEWTSTADRGYRVHGSTNATTWTPYSDWIQASGATTGFTLPPRTNGAPHLFRVEVQP